jgi:hypothetical protein
MFQELLSNYMEPGYHIPKYLRQFCLLGNGVSSFFRPHWALILTLQDLNPLKVFFSLLGEHSRSFTCSKTALVCCSLTPTCLMEVSCPRGHLGKILDPAPAAGGFLWMWEHGGLAAGGLILDLSQLHINERPK